LKQPELQGFGGTHVPRLPDASDLVLGVEPHPQSAAKPRVTVTVFRPGKRRPSAPPGSARFDLDIQDGLIAGVCCALPDLRSPPTGGIFHHDIGDHISSPNPSNHAPAIFRNDFSSFRKKICIFFSRQPSFSAKKRHFRAAHLE
jgi:hypothetical protein